MGRLKPSLGAVSTRGVVPACRSLDCVSVFATCLEDAWAGFAALAGEDRADPFSRPIV
ncbi:MAG: amidase family protein, partial [Alphaproteobacteria bacterium]